MASSPSRILCKACNENLVEDKYHLLLTCSFNKVNWEKCDDCLLHGHEKLNLILKSPQRGRSTCVQYLHIEVFYNRVLKSPCRGRSQIQDDMFICPIGQIWPPHRQ